MVASLQLQALSTTVTSVPPRLGGGGGCCKPLEWREFLQWSRPWEATLKFTFTPGPPQSLSIYHSRATLSSIPCTKAGFSLECPRALGSKARLGVALSSPGQASVPGAVTIPHLTWGHGSSCVMGGKEYSASARLVPSTPIPLYQPLGNWRNNL